MSQELSFGGVLSGKLLESTLNLWERARSYIEATVLPNKLVGCVHITGRQGSNYKRSTILV